jgi:hypothetical protein
VADVGRGIAALASDPGSEPLEPEVCHGGPPRALFTPLAQSFATGSGLPLFTVLMIQGIGFAAPVLPYQGSPLST